jgi:hypothetical protein
MSATARLRPVRRKLPGGLVLRTATRADIEPLADFNARVHDDESHRVGTFDELGGGHPTLRLHHQLLVEEPSTRAIVSAAYLLPQRWRLESVELPVGQIEAVGTDPAYRRRGLSRIVIEGLHAMADGDGDLLTAISGVSYLYRTFGYEYAVETAGFRDLPADRVAALTGAPGTRTARLGDADALVAIRTGWTDTLDLVYVAEADRFRYDIGGHSRGSYADTGFVVATDGDDRPIAYARWSPEDDSEGYVGVSEMVLGAGSDPASTAHALVASVLAAATERLGSDRAGVRLWLGSQNQIYEALAGALEPLWRPYAWYVRIPDLSALLRAIGPVLQSRLAASALAGFGGSLTVDRFVETVRLDFEDGRLAAVTSAPPRETDGPRGDLAIPPLLFAQLVLGYRTIAELRAIYPDVWYRPAALGLIEALFPRLSAWVPVFG